MFRTSAPTTSFGTMFAGQAHDSVLESRIKYCMSESGTLRSIAESVALP